VREDTDVDKLELTISDLLSHLAEEWTEDEHLADTPRRVAAFYRDFLDYHDDNIDTTFNGVHADQLIAAKGIRTWSLCAHHLLPFSATINIGYIAQERIVGISKLARIAKLAAHRLTLQEQLVVDIANHLEKLVGSDVAVTAAGEHLCMTMRGVETEATIHSQVMRGAFRDNVDTRAEFLNLS
jgi:GTP cyclohydrolase I